MNQWCFKARRQLSSYWARLHNNYPLPKRQVLDSSKFEENADDNLNFVENGRKLSKRVENTVGKREIAC